MYDFYAWIKPGDIGFDKGIGLSGFLIRTGTQSQHGHCWIYHEKLAVHDDLSETWLTVEAGPKEGLIYRHRRVAPNKVVRIWRSEKERLAILEKSSAMVGQKYGWGEIARIVLRILGIKIKKGKDNPNRAICSNHVAQCVLAAFPHWRLFMKYEYFEIWPGELAQTLDVIRWMQDRTKDGDA